MCRKKRPQLLVCLVVADKSENNCSVGAEYVNAQHSTPPELQTNESPDTAKHFVCVNAP